MRKEGTGVLKGAAVAACAWVLALFRGASHGGEIAAGVGKGMTRTGEVAETIPGSGAGRSLDDLASQGGHLGRGASLVSPLDPAVLRTRYIKMFDEYVVRSDEVFRTQFYSQEVFLVGANGKQIISPSLKQAFNEKAYPVFQELAGRSMKRLQKSIRSGSLPSDDALNQMFRQAFKETIEQEMAKRSAKGSKKLSVESLKWDALKGDLEIEIKVGKITVKGTPNVWKIGAGGVAAWVAYYKYMLTREAGYHPPHEFF